MRTSLFVLSCALLAILIANLPAGEAVSCADDPTLVGCTDCTLSVNAANVDCVAAADPSSDPSSNPSSDPATNDDDDDVTSTSTAASADDSDDATTETTTVKDCDCRHHGHRGGRRGRGRGRGRRGGRRGRGGRGGRRGRGGPGGWGRGWGGRRDDRWGGW